MGIIHSDPDLATAWGHGFNAPDDAANPYGTPRNDVRTPFELLAKTQVEDKLTGPFRPVGGEPDVAPFSPEPRPSQKPAASRQADALEQIAFTLDQIWILMRDKENRPNG